MNEQLKYLLRTFSEFDEHELEKICSAFTYKKVKKNVILLNQGRICKEVYYIKKGCIRIYFITRQGREKTRLINLEGSIGTAFASFLNQLGKPTIWGSLQMDDAIFDRYMAKGFYDIRKMNSLLKDEKELNTNYKKLSEVLKSEEFRRHRRIQDQKLRLYYEQDNWSQINEMVQDGVLIKEDDTLKINQAMRDTIEKFTIFLKNKGEHGINKMMHRPYYEMEYNEEFKESVSDRGE
ncbi:Crp/Fnr family transcriptional regulator [Sinomicrobium oceani]|uniref:Crp/Fnr family transcriptional regulator n=1 Tax=Sinomicrobium oceani TaxID=1150368 RepID=UPI00227CFD9E|nr:cyclic nucleotide-binding domain-containing protein [Sinomicrobium oceani]